MLTNALMKSAFIVLLLSAGAGFGAASAAPRSPTVPTTEQACLAMGGWWMRETKQCAYKSCRHDSGKTYSPGSTVITTTRKIYMCDGVTGTWTRLE